MDESQNINCYNFAEKSMSLIPINVVWQSNIEKATNPHVHALVAISVEIFDRPASADCYFSCFSNHLVNAPFRYLVNWGN